MITFKTFLFKESMSELDITRQDFETQLKERFQIDLRKFKDSLKGGVADNLTIEEILQVPISELIKGIDVEFEHTDDPYIAMEIALDHLFENPPTSFQYYVGLEKMESELGI